jgi:restriction endonuclease S subunit
MTRTLEIRPFGSFADFRNGVNFSASSRGGGDLAVIGVGDFQNNERLVDFTRLERISRLVGLEDDVLLRDGDLVFVRSNGNKKLIGRCMIIKGVKGAVTHSGFTIRARIASPEIDPEWVLQYFATGLAKRDIMRRGGGTNISNLSQQILRDLPIPVPSPEYQQQLLRTSKRFSQTLQLLGSLLKAKRAFKRGLTQQLLGGLKRFPEFTSSSGRQPSEFGTVPSDWAVVPIGEIAREIKERGAIDGSVVYSCTKHDGLVPSLEYFGKQIFSRNLGAYKRLETGDFAYATNHIEEGSIGLLQERHSPGLVSPMYTVFRPTDRVNREFLFAMLKTESYRRVFARRTNASVSRRGSLRWKEFSRIKVGVPSRQEQDRIAETLRLVDLEISQVAHLRNLVKTQKRALLHRLLSGEISAPA